MKAVLEFQLPEEQDAFNLATNQGACSAAIAEMREYLRVQIKYTEDEHQPDIHAVWDRFHDIINEWGIDL